MAETSGVQRPRSPFLGVREWLRAYEVFSGGKRTALGGRDRSARKKRCQGQASDTTRTPSNTVRFVSVVVSGLQTDAGHPASLLA